MPKRKKRSNSAYTLLELIAASAITSLVLVMTLALMRDSMELSRKIETNNAMTTLAVSKMEQQLAAAAASFTETTQSGDFTSEGRPELNYQVTRSQQIIDGGIPDRLMAVTATVWHDEDNDNVLDTGEASVNFSSKIAKMVIYQNAASGS